PGTPSSGGSVGSSSSAGTSTSTSTSSSSSASGGSTAHAGGPGPAVAMKVSAWLPDWAGAAGVTTAPNDAGTPPREVNPGWYGVAATGALTRRSIARDTAFVTRMHAQGTAVVPMVDDFAISGATPVLTDPVKCALLRDSLVAEVVNYNLDGVDIDFE